MKKPADTNAYIASFPADIRMMLEELRHTIIHAAPHATETISYGMPAYKQHGMLVYFAAQSKHIGFYPGAKAIEVFANELTPYETSKGTIRFPVDAPLPFDLVTRITQFRVKDDQDVYELKKAKKSKK